MPPDSARAKARAIANERLDLVDPAFSAEACAWIVFTPPRVSFIGAVTDLENKGIHAALALPSNRGIEYGNA